MPQSGRGVGRQGSFWIHSKDNLSAIDPGETPGGVHTLNQALTTARED